MWATKKEKKGNCDGLGFMFNRGAIIAGREEERRDGDLLTTGPTDLIDVFNNLWLLF